MAMNLQDIVALALVAVAAAYAVRQMWKSMSGVKSCGHGCAASRGGGAEQRERARPKHLPLITPEQIGLPGRAPTRTGTGYATPGSAPSPHRN